MQKSPENRAKARLFVAAYFGTFSQVLRAGYAERSSHVTTIDFTMHVYFDAKWPCRYMFACFTKVIALGVLPPSDTCKNM